MKMSLFPFLLLLVLPLTSPLHSSDGWSTRVVNTKFGSIRPLQFTPKGLDGVDIFYGVPYASAPVGKQSKKGSGLGRILNFLKKGSLRLMPPVSGSPWTGIKMNLIPEPVCPQALPILNETESLKVMPKGRFAQLKRLLPMLKNQSEDCLYLNIYVPSTVGSGKAGNLPVLVFIPGEDYGWGGGHPYDPSLLSSQGVVVVTVTFRVGILGFLNSNSDGYFNTPSNLALLDIIASLHFVQENINVFGGDPGAVTLMGHGRGGIYVNFLMISSTVPTGLLFQKVILNSGSALSPLASGLSNGKELAKRFAASMKCPMEPPSTMLHCLRQLPLQNFVQSELWGEFGPSDDGVIIEEGIRENVLRDKLSHYPLLFGITKAELLPSLSDHDAVYGMESEKRREILRSFVDKHYSVHRNEILAAAIHEYTDWERPIQHPISVRDETLDALSDAQITAPLVKVGDLHSQTNSKSYFYVFEYQSKVSSYQQRLGCPYGEELLYIFGVPLLFNNDFNQATDQPSSLGFFTGNFSRNEIQLSQTVMAYWINFLKTGNPNEEKSGESDPSVRTSNEKSKSRVVEWPFYDPLYKKYLSIDIKIKARSHFRAHKLAFWLQLIPDLMRNSYNTPSVHHTLHPNPVIPSSAHPKSGLVILPDESHNFSTLSPPTIHMVGPGPSSHSHPWEQNTNQQHGKFYPGSSSDSTDPDGVQMYSTALSVTIAIGCSLLILNILIFAAFYYQRDKRRAEELDTLRESNNSQPMSSLSVQKTHSHVHTNSTYSQGRKENGQIPRKSGPSNQQAAYELPIPDAILSAKYQDHEESPQSSGRSYESGTRTVPRPPKRTTPTVKFGMDLESSESHPHPPPQFVSQTLKPSLKKPFNFSSDELRV